MDLLSVSPDVRERLRALPFPVDKPATRDESFRGYVVPSASDLQQGSPARQEWRRIRSASGARSVAVLYLRQPMARIRGKKEDNWQSRMRGRALKLMAGTASKAKGERFLVPALTLRALVPATPLPLPPPPPPPPQQHDAQLGGQRASIKLEEQPAELPPPMPFGVVVKVEGCKLEDRFEDLLRCKRFMTVEEYAAKRAELMNQI